MAKTICKLCGEDIPIDEGRTSHLKKEHQIEPFDGVVDEYFLHPWQIHTVLAKTGATK